MIKKIKRWFYLQLQIMVDAYMREDNPLFTYEETHPKRVLKSIKKHLEQWNERVK